MTAPEKLAHYATWLERDGGQVHLIQLPETSHIAKTLTVGPS